MPMKPWWLVSIAFVAGCAVTSALQVPNAHAENKAHWEHLCVDVEGVPSAADVNNPSAEGWELVSAAFRPPVVAKGDSVGGGATLLCFKRAR